MNVNDAIKGGIEMADMISMSYLADLNEDELMHRPCEKANHIKWQIGHLIASDNQMINGCCAGTVPALPEGFTEKYSKEAAANNDASAFHSKDDLLTIYQTQKEAILNKLATLSEQDLDQPSPESMQQYAPTVGSAFNMIGQHWIMHAGQWAVVRRQLGREPLF